MTTYELPQEPPVGSRVRDHHGHVWTHTNDGWSHPDLRSSGLSWGAVMAYAPLIVATLNGRRELFTLRKDGGYESAVSLVWPTGSNRLTNVVPVAVVPTAEWEALKRRIRNDGERTPNQRRVVVTRAAEELMYVTDALGLDQ